MEGLMLHCGAESATWDEVCNAPMPVATRSYSPVPYKDIVEIARERLRKEFGADEDAQSWSFGLQNTKSGGSRFFSLCRIEMDSKDWGFSIGLRSSTDKSIKIGAAFGANVFVCDNLCLSSDGLVLGRMHTGDAYEDFRKMLFTGIADSAYHYSNISEDLTSLKGIGCDRDRGFELLGLAMGHNVLGKQEVSVAVDEWKNPSHDEFCEDNLYSLYNCFTEAAKKTRAPGAVFNKYSGIHGFFGEATDVQFRAA